MDDVVRSLRLKNGRWIVGVGCSSLSEFVLYRCAMGSGCLWDNSGNMVVGYIVDDRALTPTRNSRFVSEYILIVS